MEEWLQQLIAMYGCNGRKFSYVIFTEQWNVTTAEWRNGNGMVEIRHKRSGVGCFATPH